MTTTNKKAPLWSTTQITAIEAIFSAGGNLDNDDCIALAKTEEFTGKTVNSVRSKVVSLGYYQAAKKTPVGSGGVVTQRKMEFVNAIETLASLEKGALASLEKASKPQLEKLSAALVALSEKQDADKQAEDKQ